MSKGSNSSATVLYVADYLTWSNRFLRMMSPRAFLALFLEHLSKPTEKLEYHPKLFLCSEQRLINSFVLKKAAKSVKILPR